MQFKSFVARRFFLERARLGPEGRSVPCSVGDFVDRDFYLVVTNGRSNHGSNDVPNVTYWDTQGLSGTYTVTLKATDVRDFAFASSRKFIWDAMGVKIGDKTVSLIFMFSSYFAGMKYFDQFSRK